MKNADHRKERFLKHMPDLMDPILITLKGHMLIEELLDEIIASRCQYPDGMKGVDLTFFVKSRLAFSLIGEGLKNGIPLPTTCWKMIDALNELRNVIAHKLESQKLNKKLEAFIKSTGNEISIEEMSQSEINKHLDMAISFLIGHFSTITEIVVDYEKLPRESKDEA